MNYNIPRINRIIENMKIPYNSTANVVEIYEAIYNNSIAARVKPESFKWALTADNVLTVDGKPLKRVGPKVNYFGHYGDGPRL